MVRCKIDGRDVVIDEQGRVDAEPAVLRERLERIVAEPVFTWQGFWWLVVAFVRLPDAFGSRLSDVSVAEPEPADGDEEVEF